MAPGRTTLHVATAIWSVLAIAPWAVYLAGLCQITNDLVSYFINALWIKQGFIMLEWWTIWFEFFIIIATFVFTLLRRTKGSAYWLNAFLATNSALITLRATSRITQATMLNDGATLAELEDRFPVDSIAALGTPSEALQRVRLTAAGQVSTVFANFVLNILLGHCAAGEVVALAGSKGAPPNAA